MITSTLNDFNAGELSPYLKGRIDMKPYHKGAETVENMFVLPYGGVKKRSGGEFISSANESTSPHSLIRLVPFTFSQEETYVIEIGQLYLRFFQNGERINREYSDWVTSTDYNLGDLRTDSGNYYRCLVTHTSGTFATDLSNNYWEETEGEDDIAYQIPSIYEFKKDAIIYDYYSTYSKSDIVYYKYLFYKAKQDIAYKTWIKDKSSWEEYEVGNDFNKIQFVQSADVIFMVHPNYPPQKLSRTDASEPHFIMKDMDFDNVPFRDNNADEDSTLYIELKTTDGAWTTATAYVIGNTVTVTEVGFEATYICIEDHTSDATSFENDLEKWAYSGGAVGDISTVYSKEDFFSSNMVGNLFKIEHEDDNSLLDVSLEVLDGAVSQSLPVYGDYSFRTSGKWAGIIELLKRKIGTLNWEVVKSYTSTLTDTSPEVYSNNYDSDGQENEYGYEYSIYYNITSITATANAKLTKSSFKSKGIVQIDAYNSPTEVDVTVIQEVIKPGEVNKTDQWAEAAWSDKNGYPATIDLYEERLWYGGSNRDAQTLWVSRIGNYYDFELGSLDTHALQLTFSSSQINNIQWLKGKKSMIVGTLGGEWELYSSDDDEAITATNLSLRRHTNYGSTHIQPYIVNDSILFVESGGKILRELAYNFEKDGYVAPDLTLLAEHITGSGIVQIALQRTPYTRLWCLTKDGDIAVLTYNRAQEIIGWSKIKRQNEYCKYRSISIIETLKEDEVWLAYSEDHILNSIQIERINNNSFLDSSQIWIGKDLNRNGEINTRVTSEPVGNIFFAPSFYLVEVNYKNGDKIKIYNKNNEKMFDTIPYFFIVEVTMIGNNGFFFGRRKRNDIISFSNNETPVTVTFSSNHNLQEYQAVCFYGTIGDTPQNAKLFYIKILDATRVQLFDYYTGAGISNTSCLLSDGYMVELFETSETFLTKVTFEHCESSLQNVGHLKNKDFYVFGDGNLIVTNKTISDEGEIELDNAYHTLHIGLPYDSLLKTMPLSPTLEYSSPSGKKKNISEAIIRVKDTSVFEYGVDEDNLMTSSPKRDGDVEGEAVPLQTGVRRELIKMNSSDDVAIIVKQSAPLPLEVLNITTHMEIYRR